MRIQKGRKGKVACAQRERGERTDYWLLICCSFGGSDEHSLAIGKVEATTEIQIKILKK